MLEVGQILAGPFAGAMLAYFGAEVIKVEPPDGDPIRGWRLLDGGTSLWWRSLARNKKCITLNLRKAEGQSLLRRLAARSDVLIENFRPGTLEGWGLGPADLEAVNPRLLFARVSGFGQTGPYAGRAGYAAVCEAVGGLRAVTGFPGGVPVRANLSLGDTVAGLHTVIGILLGLVDRLRRQPERGQVIDVAIYEAVFNLLESTVPEYDRFGVVRQPSGATITGVVPSNLYPTADGKQVIIGANSDPMFRRLMRALGRPDLAEDPRLAVNAGRVEHQAEVDEAIASWTRGRSVAEALAVLEQAGVAAGSLYDVADMFRDPHFQERGLFETVETPEGPLKVPALAPKLSATPGATEWGGSELGAHTEEVLRELVGLSAEEIERLRGEGVI